MYNFDKAVERRNTNSVKYDFAIERGMPKDILPLWIADMDFTVPNEIIEKIHQVADHGIFGYCDAKEGYSEAIINWIKNEFDFKLDSEFLITTPGVVFALATAVKAYTNIGDSVIIFSPVYYPFSEVIKVNERKLIKSSLVLNNGKYYMDFEDFENKIIENKVKLFIQCSPHNPIGRVWTKEELMKVAEICFRHNVIVVSDEIHMDFVYEGYKHTVFPSISEEAYNNSCLLTAPSKTFNLAGLQSSNIFIKNKELREKFKLEVKKTGYANINSFGLVACEQAYRYGKPWLSELKKYLKGNLDFLRKFLEDNLPEVKLIEPEGTYLAWLDFSKYGDPSCVNDTIINKAGVWLDKGEIFGTEGYGYQRVNLACTRVTLEKCLVNIKEALEN